MTEFVVKLGTPFACLLHSSLNIPYTIFIGSIAYYEISTPTEIMASQNCWGARSATDPDIDSRVTLIHGF